MHINNLRKFSPRDLSQVSTFSTDPWSQAWRAGAYPPKAERESGQRLRTAAHLCGREPSQRAARPLGPVDGQTRTEYPRQSWWSHHSVLLQQLLPPPTGALPTGARLQRRLVQAGSFDSLHWLNIQTRLRVHLEQVALLNHLTSAALRKGACCRQDVKTGPRDPLVALCNKLRNGQGSEHVLHKVDV